MRQTTKNILLISLASLLCSACSAPNITPNYSGEKTRDGKKLGTLHFSDSAQEDSAKINLYRERKGYAMRANLDEDAETERKGDIVFARNKEYKWFAGLNWKFSF
jgi:hypothetical protein